ncbi:MAG: NAD(P)/FAD-dependent oxidoreductase [Myxococcales bacterium]|nr:NAD(P)/FAD-dependent oxidoreductase [Myxococcales bacterium]
MGADEFPVAVIGAGLCGIGAGIRLKQAGIHSFTIFERADRIGGTWRDNQYPGAACDVPAHLYSFSFAQNPDWSRTYAGAPEIWRYTADLVRRFELEPHLRLSTAITGARFDEASGLWHLQTDQGEEIRARAVLAGMGALVDPQLPDLEGLDDFAGETFHTARWNHDCSLQGKRVAVVGTGASAVQVVPAIASEVAQLRVFQRTPSWVLPRLDVEHGPRRRWLYRHVPGALWLSRLRTFLSAELRGPVVYLDSPRLSTIGERMSLRHLEEQVPDPELRARLTPDYQFGCKRVLVSSDYWPTFNEPHVQLITDPIHRIEQDGLRTADGTLHASDVIVLATGFDVSLNRPPFPVEGRHGSLSEAWQHGASSYLGMMVHGFPNWFFLMGPNTAPGHTSVLVYAEAQLDYAVRAVRHLQRRGLRWMDVRAEAQQAYDDSLQARMPHMSWSSGCSSWYLSDDGVNRSLYPGPASEYVWRTRRLKRRDFHEAPG